MSLPDSDNIHALISPPAEIFSPAQVFYRIHYTERYECNREWKFQPSTTEKWWLNQHCSDVIFAFTPTHVDFSFCGLAHRRSFILPAKFKHFIFVHSADKGHSILLNTTTSNGAALSWPQWGKSFMTEEIFFFFVAGIKWDVLRTVSSSVRNYLDLKRENAAVDLTTTNSLCMYERWHCVASDPALI